MAKAVGTTPKQLLPFAKVRASLPDSTWQSTEMTFSTLVRIEESQKSEYTYGFSNCCCIDL